MRSRVVPTHQRGLQRPKRDISRADGIIGEMTTVTWTDDLIRRTTLVATLSDIRAGAQVAELLPPLYDVALVLIAPGGMMFRGCERIAFDDGRFVEFAQEWWARSV